MTLFKQIQITVIKGFLYVYYVYVLIIQPKPRTVEHSACFASLALSSLCIFEHVVWKHKHVLKHYTKQAAKPECGVDNAQPNTCAGILLLEILHRQLEDTAAYTIRRAKANSYMKLYVEPNV